MGIYNLEKVLNLMERMGQNVNDIDTWEKLIIESPIFISEGLIKTYDSKLVYNSIASSFKLRKNGIEPKISLLKMRGLDDIYIGDIFFKNGKNDEEEIKIILDTNESFIKVIEQKMNKYGWSLYREDEGYDNRTEFVFEKKFPTCFKTKDLIRFTDELYHQTLNKLSNKILKQGLIPKESKSPGFYNEPRIYLWLKLENEEINDKSFINARSEEDIINFKINLNKLDINHKFFIDNRMDNALFTLEPIPPTAIEIIK